MFAACKLTPISISVAQGVRRVQVVVGKKGELLRS